MYQQLLLHATVQILTSGYPSKQWIQVRGNEIQPYKDIFIVYMYIVGKYIIYLYELYTQVEKPTFVEFSGQFNNDCT